MDEVQELLFGKFPRAVGNPHQHFVHSRPEMDAYIDANDGENNLYASISHYTADGVAVTDKVVLDFDSAKKETSFPFTEADDEKIDMMREDMDLAEDVLGEVLREVREVVEWTQEREIPSLAVFTGFGIHFHMLYGETVYPKKQLTSTAVKLQEELGLRTLDRVPIGDVHRIMRIPNCHRTYKGRKCYLRTIPIHPNELLQWEVDDLLEESMEERIPDNLPNGHREEMKIYDGYLRTESDPHKEPIEYNEHLDFDDDYIEWLLKEALKLPCMWKRIMQPNPSHDIRRNAAVMLFNYGLEPPEVYDIFQRLNWVDWNSSITKEQLEHIYNNNYADMSCETLQSRGLCVFDKEDREPECPTYEWTGGNQEY